MSASDASKSPQDRESDPNAPDGDSAAKRTQPSKDLSRSSPRAEITQDDERKLEEMRKKLKGIFAAAEPPPAPKEDTIKAGSSQTASSGLLDLRDLAKSRAASQASEQRADDDLLLLSGGLFDGSKQQVSLAPPDLSKKAAPAPKPPPPVRASKPADVEEVDVDVEPESKAAAAKRTTSSLVSMSSPSPDIDAPPPKPALTGGKIAGIAVVFVALLGGVFYVTMSTGGDDADTKGKERTGVEVGANAGASASPGLDTGSQAPKASAAVDSQPAAVNAIDPGAKAPAATSAAASAAAKTEPASAGSAAATAKTPAGEKPPTSTATAATTAGGAPTPPPPATTPSAAPPPPPPPPPATKDFDTAAASAAMNAAAGAAAGCKGEDGSGSASVSVTFAPSGRVTSAKIDGGKFQGTPTGGCIATAFRSARVPAFDGGPVTVKKTVNIR